MYILLFFQFGACKEVDKSYDISSMGESSSAEECHPEITGWPPSSNRLELEAIELINQRRAQGANCGTMGQFNPTDPLRNDSDIQCAARYHALWMGQNDELTHDSPGGALGSDFAQRLGSTDYGGWPVGENVAAGYNTAEQVVAGWMSSDGHCANIMEPSAEEIGVGFYHETTSFMGYFWSMTTGVP